MTPGRDAIPIAVLITLCGPMFPAEWEVFNLFATGVLCRSVSGVVKWLDMEGWLFDFEARTFFCGSRCFRFPNGLEGLAILSREDPAGGCIGFDKSFNGHTGVVIGVTDVREDPRNRSHCVMEMSRHSSCPT